MPKQPLSFILCLLFSITFIAISPFPAAHADDLSQGMQLYQAKKYREAVPYLEKAAKEGHEEALKALDEIYADETPAVDMTDKADKTAKAGGKTAAKTADAAKPADAATAGAEKVPAPMYEKATVAEDPKEAADRAFMRKVLFLSTAVIIVLIWVIQYFLLRKLRNRNFRKETPADAAKTGKTVKPGK